jgi:hypothetical protein
MTLLTLGRAKQGTVGERSRSVHVFVIREVVQAAARPGVLMAVCGRRFRVGELDFLDAVLGMPCEVCLARPSDPDATTDDVVSAIGDSPNFDLEIFPVAASAEGSRGE